jgi:hypothetical protein
MTNPLPTGTRRREKHVTRERVKLTSQLPVVTWLPVDKGGLFSHTHGEMGGGRELLA